MGKENYYDEGFEKQEPGEAVPDEGAKGDKTCEEGEEQGAAVPGDEESEAAGQEEPDPCDDVYDEDDYDRETCDSDHNRELGRRGEQAAVRYLVANGFEILERNWRCRFGEVDIIARDVDGSICFVEVKTRKSLAMGMPEEAITPQKQSRYERIALTYMTKSDWEEGIRLRFDCIGICVTSADRALLRHHRGCFDGRF